MVDIIEDKEESKADQAKDDSTDDNQQQTTEETEKLESQNKDSPSTDKPSEDIASSHKKTGEENEHDKPTAEKAKDRTTKKAKKSLEEEWQDALAQARNQLKSVVRKQLKGMGIDPNGRCLFLVLVSVSSLLLMYDSINWQNTLQTDIYVKLHLHHARKHKFCPAFQLSQLCH